MLNYTYICPEIRLHFFLGYLSNYPYAQGRRCLRFLSLLHCANQTNQLTSGLPPTLSTPYTFPYLIQPKPSLSLLMLG